jgi:hypothetical protein
MAEIGTADCFPEERASEHHRFHILPPIRADREPSVNPSRHSSLIERKTGPLNDCEFRRRETLKMGCPAVKRERHASFFP